MKNIYQIITDKILEELGKGNIPWRKPWICVGGASCISYTTRKPYSILNQILLGEPGEYLTFNQVKSLGGSVKKGAKSKMICFYNIVEKVVTNEKGEDELRRTPYLRYYNVFHINDTDGIPTKEKAVELKNTSPIEDAEKIITDYIERDGKLTFTPTLGDRAFYAPATDSVVVPLISQYENAEEYYSTCFHELTHSTLKPYRCNRESDGKAAAFGDKVYSREELVAEIGSSILCYEANLDDAKT
ncbi:MAG: zincin-like metallopeptidase domain-containing protein, partial [Pyramidobacter sp.]|nr:zincin-like metallopeptidase domain-containing protein [Pyramidobacter sp.]